MDNQPTNQPEQGQPIVTNPVVSPPENSSKKRPSKKVIALILVVLIAAIGIVAYATRDSEVSQAPVQSSATPQTVTVDINSKGFFPESVNIKKGTIVIWKSSDTTKSAVVASDPYPTNDILKELKSPQLGNGANYRYQFNNAGTFTYHDDLNPAVKGAVVVE